MAQNKADTEMTREQIEKAARDYALYQLGIVGLPGRAEEMKAFIAGAQWRINSVWHDTFEMPERNRDFLYESARGWFGINNITKMAREVYPENWDRFVEGFDVIRWAYISDLLPERKERKG